MKSDSPQAAPETHAGYWRRVLRPLFWWGILVVVLFAVHQHQLALERTRIYFSFNLQETNVLTEAVVMLDGQPLANGDKISLGSHRFTITHPKAESFATNFFAWYGRHDFGKLNLKRGMGTLNVAAEPAAKMITITGPEFSLTLHDSAGTNVLVPTDTYHVSARYTRRSDERNFEVTAGNVTHCTFAPHMGTISLSCNETPASFELLDGNGNLVERGDVPAFLTELPSGRYAIRVAYGNWEVKHEVSVLDRETNDVPFHFTFGAARFESVPPGAQVFTANGAYLGVTPVVVTDLVPSTADYRLQLNGYDAATVRVPVAENETNMASATLVSLSYLGSLRTAKQDMESGNYKNALASLDQSLTAKPGDTEALNLQTSAKVRYLVQEAKGLAKAGDYVTAGQKLEAALEILPDDVEAKNLQSDYRKHEAEQRKLNAERQKADAAQQEATAEAGAEKQRQERLNRPHDYFAKMMGEKPHSADFVDQMMKANGDASDLRGKIADALSKSLLLKFTIEQNEEPFPGGFLIRAKISMLDGVRRCYIVGGQTADGEVTIVFKVMEYAWPPDLTLAALVSRPSDDKAIPLGQSNLSPSAKESRRELGIKIVRERIQQAIHQFHTN